MPRIDSLTNPQRQALDDVRDGISLAARARKNTIDALLDRGYIEATTSGTSLKFTLTEAGRTLYIESDMRATKPADFQEGDEVEALNWRSSDGKEIVQWEKGKVERIGSMMLTILFADGLGLRRAYYVRKAQPPAPPAVAPTWSDMVVATIDAAHLLLREQKARIASLEAERNAMWSLLMDVDQCGPYDLREFAQDNEGLHDFPGVLERVREYIENRKA